MTVKEQKPIVFDNKCGCIVDYKELEKAMLWYSEKPMLSQKSIYLHAKYPCVSIQNEKIHVHRLLMMYWLNKRLPQKINVHHINGDKLDASEKNLEIIEASKHNSLHNKGRKFSKEHRMKIGLANQRRKGIKQRKRVNIPLDELKSHLISGKSILAISNIYGCDWSTIKARIEENPELLEAEG